MFPFYKKIFPVIYFAISAAVTFAQPVQLSPVVVSSGGGYATAGGNSYSFTIGESVITTMSGSNVVLTQGFHQPLVTAGSTLSITLTIVDANCLTAHNGEAQATVNSGTPPYTYSWSPEGGNSQTATGLAPGTYYLLVTDALGNEGRDTLTIGALNDDACDIHVYKGITPNGDGINDTWIIDGITLFPDNMVTIYNRWGEKIWGANGYNNEDKLWRGNDMNGDNLPDGTYYYILEIVGSDSWRGWVQVTR